MISQKIVQQELKRKGGVSFAKKYDIDKMIQVCADLEYWLDQKRSSSKFAYLFDGIKALKDSDPKYTNLWKLWYKGTDLKDDWEDILFKVRRELEQIKKIQKTIP